jgi:hypothetical protein
MTIPIVLRPREELDIGALELALTALVARHETLRTTYAWKGRALTATVHSPSGCVIDVRDYRAAPDAPATLAADLDEEIATDVDPTQWPMRARLWRMPAGRDVLCLAVHHLALDALSIGLLRRDLSGLYERCLGRDVPELPPVAMQYTDFVAWQAKQLDGPALARHLRYWTAQLAGARSLDLPVGAEGAGHGRTRMARLPLGDGVVAELDDLARRERTSLFGVLLAVFFSALSAETGQQDLAVTTLLSHRLHPALAGTVGYFASATVLRARVEPEEPFAELVRRCRATLLGALQHQALPFHLLPPRVVDKAAVRVDQVVLQLLDDPGDAISFFEPWEVRESGVTGRTFDLEVVILPLYGAWHVMALYAGGRFDPAWIERLLAGVARAAGAAAAGAVRPG